MSAKVHYLTSEGRKKLEDELYHLKTVRRQEVAHNLKEAIEEGDLSENSAYDEAKREQAFMEGRIQEIEAVLSGAQLLEETSGGDEVALGSRVTVAEEGGDHEVYQIVGPAEADPANGRISHESPLGMSLMGGRPGDRVQVNTPGGVIDFDIISIA